MSKQWRILVVQDDEHPKRNIVNSLQNDGYVVQGVASGAEAIRLLWSGEYDVVISDQKMPNTDGFELLQWMRTYRPNTRMIMVAAPGSPITRTQALESGVVSYLEKPLDLHILKEELRRLLQQTGFSANLDSFDLLDVVQIVNMSHKTIAMVVNTGLEEQGLLGFQEGELVWAEYGVLRGEEAFYALAAHKNGTVTHQYWNAQVKPNVTQPLSRIIFQALKYRSKYAALQQQTGEQAALAPAAPPAAIQASGDDDRPFLFVEPARADAQPQTTSNYTSEASTPMKQEISEPVEWWQEPVAQARSNKTGDVRAVEGSSNQANMSSVADDQQVANSSDGARDPGTTTGNINISTVRKTPAGQRADLPSWLMDHPTQAEMPAMRPSSLSGSGKVSAVPTGKVSPAEWQPSPPAASTAEQSSNKQGTSSPDLPSIGPVPQQNSRVSSRRQSPPEWQAPESITVNKSQSADSQSLTLQSLASVKKTDDLFPPVAKQVSGPLSTNGPNFALSSSDLLAENLAVETDVTRPSSPERAKPGADAHSHHASKRNYSALAGALQTLGYSIQGFVATAVVSIDGQPIAQVAVDDLDISLMCGHFTSILQGVLLSLDQGTWGDFDDTVITSLTHHILIRLLGSDKEAFQVLITTRESDPRESLKIMTNVEAAIVTAL
jgi:DNA-binding response OmpR family regulator/predicted regulator of Ras-like GTPase activity (Roadblock/LC7/MglB family)